MCIFKLNVYNVWYSVISTMDLFVGTLARISSDLTYQVLTVVLLTGKCLLQWMMEQGDHYTYALVEGRVYFQCTKTNVIIIYYPSKLITS